MPLMFLPMILYAASVEMMLDTWSKGRGPLILSFDETQTEREEHEAGAHNTK